MNLTDENFEAEIKNAKKPVLVDFFAVWCEPCNMLAPVLKKVSDELKDKIILEKVNVDEFPITSQKFQIDRIPAVILFKDGKPAGGFIGVRPEADIKNWLKKEL